MILPVAIKSVIRIFLLTSGAIFGFSAADGKISSSIVFHRRIGQTMSLDLGYRYFEDDYDNLPSYAWDMTQEGPVVGYTWVF